MRRADLGRNLSEARKKQGMTLGKVADAVDTSVAKLSKWEHGRGVPTILQFAELCRVLNLSADEILELK